MLRAPQIPTFDHPGSIGVMGQPGATMSIGVAHPTGLMDHRRAPVQTFRLVIGKVELPGRWICVGREFVQLGEVAEEL